MNPFDLDFVRLGARRSLVNSIINLEKRKDWKKVSRGWEMGDRSPCFVNSLGNDGISLIGCEIEFYVAFPPLSIPLSVLNLTVCCPV